MGILDRSHRGTPASAAMFQDAAGHPTSLAAFAGRPVLLNLWATWCAPCVAEMPTLDRAARTINVVAVSEDLDGATKVVPFLAKARLNTLARYLDPQARLSVAYNASLPTSILYDARGREVWRMTGGMNWTTPTAAALLAEAR